MDPVDHQYSGGSDFEPIKRQSVYDRSPIVPLECGPVHDHPPAGFPYLVDSPSKPTWRTTRTISAQPALCTPCLFAVCRVCDANDSHIDDDMENKEAVNRSSHRRGESIIRR